MKIIFKYNDNAEQVYQSNDLYFSYIEEYNKETDAIKFDLNHGYSGIGIMNKDHKNLMRKYIKDSLTEIVVEYDTTVMRFSLETFYRYKITFLNNQLYEVLFVKESSIIN